MKVFRIAVLLGLCLLPVSVAQEISERSTPELLRFGKALYERGECFSSRYLFQQVLEREPQNLEALSGKGRALVCEGSFNEGLDALEQVAELSPKVAAVYTQLAGAYLKQYESDPETHESRLQDALDALEQADAQGANSASVMNLRGVVYYRQDDLQQAKEALEEATAKAPEVADYRRNLGLVYVRLGDTEAAIKTLRRAVSLEPENALGHNQLGQAYLLSGRCDDAVFELEQAATLAPNLAEVNLNLGIANFDCENFGAAQPYFEKVIALEPTAFAPAYTYLARIDLEENDLDSAVTQATKGALIRPANAEAYYWLGQTYEARNGTASDGTSDSDKAEDAYRRALELDPLYVPAQDALDAM